MRSYNGFSAQQRMRALQWLKREIAEGRRRSPTRCDDCGETKGVQPHTEDYSEPFGDHIGAHAFCQRCHRKLHRPQAAQSSPVGPVNLLTGETLPRKQSYAGDPIRRAEGDPVKAARKVAKKAAAALRTALPKAIPLSPILDPVKAAPEVPKFRSGARRSNDGLGPVLAALQADEGATLRECTTLSGWGAEFELRNLRILARKRGLAVTVVSGEGKNRRYRLV